MHSAGIADPPRFPPQPVGSAFFRVSPRQRTSEGLMSPTLGNEENGPSLCWCYIQTRQRTVKDKATEMGSWEAPPLSVYWGEFLSFLDQSLPLFPPLPRPEQKGTCMTTRASFQRPPHALMQYLVLHFPETGNFVKPLSCLINTGI